MTEKIVFQQVNEAACQRSRTALSKLMHSQIDMGYSQPKKVSPKRVPSLIGAARGGVGVLAAIQGKDKNLSLFLIPKQTACLLCDKVMAKDLGATKELTPFEYDLMKEVGNIILGNYLSEVSNALKVEIINGPPKISVGNFEEILQNGINAVGCDISNLVEITVTFDLADISKKAFLLLIFTPNELPGAFD